MKIRLKIPFEHALGRCAQTKVSKIELTVNFRGSGKYDNV